jgi:cation transport regulator ChaC
MSLSNESLLVIVMVGVVAGWLAGQIVRGGGFGLGLMMALDRGGQCRGVASRLRQDTLRDDLNRLLRREIITKPWINLPRMLKVTFGKTLVISACSMLSAISRRNAFRDRSMACSSSATPPPQRQKAEAGAAGIWGR